MTDDCSCPALPCNLLPSFTVEHRTFLERFRPTVRYLMQTEAHVYALAVSASVLLSFFPFCNVMLSFCRNVLHWRAAEQAIYLALNDYFPGEMTAFVKRNLSLKGDLHLASMVLLLFTANGIFEPLEVALNRTWGVHKNRSYLKNQLVSLGMIFACGALAVLSVMFTAMNRQWVTDISGSFGGLGTWLNLFFFKLAAVPLSILTLFLIYWLLPNRKVPPARVAPVAVCVGLVLEAAKYINLALMPWLEVKFEHEYFIFRHSAMILIWSFLGALIVLAGAEWTAREGAADPLS
jgi:membrane protein